MAVFVFAFVLSEFFCHLGELFCFVFFYSHGIRNDSYNKCLMNTKIINVMIIIMMKRNDGDDNSNDDNRDSVVYNGGNGGGQYA